MKTVSIVFKTGINITINCVEYSFDNDNHKLIINSNEVESIKEVEEKDEDAGRAE